MRHVNQDTCRGECRTERLRLGLLLAVLWRGVAARVSSVRRRNLRAVRRGRSVWLVEDNRLVPELGSTVSGLSARIRMVRLRSVSATHRSRMAATIVSCVSAWSVSAVRKLVLLLLLHAGNVAWWSAVSVRVLSRPFLPRTGQLGAGAHSFFF